MKEGVNILNGALEVAAPFVTKQLLGKAEGVGNEGCSLLGLLLSSPTVPLCSADSQEFLPQDLSQLHQRLAFLSTSHLVLSLKRSQLLA